MEWRLSDEQHAYQESFRDWLSATAPTHRVRRWLDAGDRSTFGSALAADWWGVGTAEEIGGQGGGLLELTLTAEELGRAAAPDSPWMTTALAWPLLASVPKVGVEIAAGATAALLIPADRIPSCPRASVELDGSGRLTGTIPRVLAGDSARWLVVPISGPHGLELRLIDGAEPGIQRVSRGLLDRSRSVADVVLEQTPSQLVEVPAVELLGQFAARAALLVSADALGASERMLDMAVEYSKQRHQFGVPIGSFQAVKHAAATMLLGVEAARSAIYLVAATIDGMAPEADRQAAAVKAQVTATAAAAADTALTLFAAIGFTWEHDLQLFFKRAKLDEQLFGSPSAWNERLADLLELAP